MKKLYAFIFVILLAFPLAGQQRTGNIFGQVVDQDGNPLPGVTVTLTGATTAPMTFITTAEGNFRFLSLFPARDYAIKVELQGFKSKVESGVIVAVGVNAEPKIIMEMGTLAEEITVTAVTPVVDTKRTTVSKTVDYTTLQSIPTARDPWVVLQMTPSVMVDRENIGGNESGQMAYYVAKGSTVDSQWTMDGVVITDPSSSGAPQYFDFDIFEEMNITTGSADVDTAYGTTAINLVTRRGGNKVTLGGRFYLTDQRFQATLSPARIKELGIVGYNKIVKIQDMGFNAGGPLLKDKIWWWGAYGTQMIKGTNIAGARDDTYLDNMMGKLNFQLIASNRLEVFLSGANKSKFGRSSSTTFPPGWNQRTRFYFGTPIFKVQDEQMLGDNLFISLKYGYTGGGFGLWPGNDESLTKMYWYDAEKDLDMYSQTWFNNGRPQDFWSAQATYFNENLFGLSHEIKIGFDFSDRRTYSLGGYPGNMWIRFDDNEKTVDWDGDGTRDVVKDLPGGPDLRTLTVNRNVDTGTGSHDWAAYFSDTISTGRFNFKIGVRFDSANPYIDPSVGRSILGTTSEEFYSNYKGIVDKATTPGTSEKLAVLLPDKKSPGVKAPINANTLSPRLGITWDVRGNGKTVAKLSGAIYSNYQGFVGDLWGYGGVGGWTSFFWWDKNADNLIDWRELYWANYASSARTPYRTWDDNGNFQGNWIRERGLNWDGWDPADPTALVPSYTTVDKNWGPTRTYEALLSIEHELVQDFGVALDLSYRQYNNFNRSSNYYPEDGHIRDKNDYMVAGQIPATFTDPKTGIAYSAKDAAGKDWYVLKAGEDMLYTPYTYRQNWANDRNNIYYGLDLRLTKRLTHRWMMDGSFSLQWQASHFGQSYEDPNNLWAQEGKLYVYSMGGGSGKLSQYVWSTWMFKAEGLYQLPLDFNVSFTLTARQGYIIPENFTVADYRLPNSRSQSANIWAKPYSDCSHLPTYWMLNLRLEKMIKIADNSRIYLMIDAFNPFNLDTLNRQYGLNYGTWYLDTKTYKAPTRSGEANEIVNPRVFRFGIRFNI